MNLRRFFRWRNLAIAACLAAVAGAGAFCWIRRPATTPAQRGLRVAERMGCFACHGPGGLHGAANPGAEGEEIPGWDGGTVMNYVTRKEEIREWILYGAPRGRKTEDQPKTHPLIAMPGYEGRLTAQELDDLEAYFKAVAEYDRPKSPEARAGHGVASRLGCFGCHGPDGRVGAANPGSFKGYIPPWEGADFAELVENDAELRAWILDGKIDRFENNPVAMSFTRAQAIAMPAYRAILKEGELEALVAYIRSLSPAR